MNMTNFVWLGILLITAGCSTAPVVNESAHRDQVERPSPDMQVVYPNRTPAAAKSVPPTKTAEPEVRAPAQAAVDYPALVRAMKMDRPIHRLGFVEKPFENCGTEYGLPAPNRPGCQKMYLVKIHFRIQCRDSDGTVSERVTEDELRAFGGREIAWTLKGIQGLTRSDESGFGELVTISPISQKAQRLKLSFENDFLYLPAGEIKRVITPRSWCLD